MEMSLEELKRENAEQEAAAKAAEPQAEKVSTDGEAAELEASEELTAEGSEVNEEQAEPVEAWMQGEEQDSPDDDHKFTGSDIAAAKRNLRVKLEKKHDSEVEQLRQEIEALKQKPQPTAATVTGKPKREDFMDKDDPDEAYVEAMLEWRESKTVETNKQQAAADAQRQAQEAIEKEVNGHYQRVEGFLAKNKIDAGVYQAADRNFRQAIDTVRPGQGDAISDVLISQIGDGSEKLMMYIGNNASRRQEVQLALTQDPSGLKFMRLVGKYEGEMRAPKQRVSKAPAPAPKVSGDASASGDASKMQKSYAAAHKAGNIQKAFDIRAEARRSKIDVSKW